MENHEILLVEDDVRLAGLVCEYLEQHEFSVRAVHRGDEVLGAMQSRPKLVILDLMLPGMDGLEVCREIRRDYRGPILMLTAKGSDIDQVVGLELGADDYVVKPVEPRVLLARVRALLRRSQHADPETDCIELAGLRINRANHQVDRDSQPLPLTTQEFELLWLLACRPGHVFSRDDIYQALRGIEYDGVDRTIDVCISHLRKKLGDDGEHPSLIKTVWGKGYLFAADASA